MRDVSKEIIIPEEIYDKKIDIHSDFETKQLNSIRKKVSSSLKIFPTPYDDIFNSYKANEENYEIYKTMAEFPICEAAIALYNRLIGRWKIESTNINVINRVNELQNNIVINRIYKGLEILDSLV